MLMGVYAFPKACLCVSTQAHLQDVLTVGDQEFAFRANPEEKPCDIVRLPKVLDGSADGTVLGPVVRKLHVMVGCLLSLTAVSKQEYLHNYLMEGING